KNATANRARNAARTAKKSAPPAQNAPPARAKRKAENPVRKTKKKVAATRATTNATTATKAGTRTPSRKTPPIQRIRRTRKPRAAAPLASASQNRATSQKLPTARRNKAANAMPTVTTQKQ